MEDQELDMIIDADLDAQAQAWETNQAMSEPQNCTQCDQPITDWTNTVEGNDGNPVCGDCHSAKLDEYKDAFDGMFGDSLGKLDKLGVA